MDVLITGASRGIGRAIAVRLGQQGANILVNYLQDEQAAEETCRQVYAAGGKASVFLGDVRSPETLQAMAKHAEKQFGGLDLLIHNAALGVLKPMEQIRVSQWDLTIETSLRPFWLLSKLCRPMLRPGGQILGITSLGSRQFTPGYAAMGACKAGVEALVRQLAVELAPDIRVNAVCGGPVRTDSLRHLHDAERWTQQVAEVTPMKRLGEPEDIAGVVALLASSDARWITGQTLVVDGGLSCL